MRIQKIRYKSTNTNLFWSIYQKESCKQAPHFKSYCLNISKFLLFTFISAPQNNQILSNVNMQKLPKIFVFVLLVLACLQLIFWKFPISIKISINQPVMNETLDGIRKNVTIAIVACGGKVRVMSDSYMLIKTAVMFNQRNNVEFYIVTEKEYNQYFIDQVSCFLTLKTRR